MEKINNFREYSIYKTEDGKQLKRGMLYRSASLHKATINDLKELEKLNIGYIIDFRSSFEALENPDKIPNNCKHFNVYINSNETGKFKNDNNVPGYKRLLAVGSKEGFGATYKELPFANPAIAKLFEIMLKNDNRAILHHCAAGKDRAGTAAAIVLRTLGVDLDTIYRDYLKSNDYYEPLMDDIFSDATIEERKKYEAYIHYVAIADIDYIKLAFEAIAEKYSTFDEYLEKEYGIDSIKKDILYKKYVEG